MPNVYTMVCWLSSIYTIFSKVLTALWNRECLLLLVLPYYPANNAWVIDFVVSNARGRGNSTSVTQINLPWTGPVPFLGMQIPCTPANPVNNSAVIDVVISGFPPPLWTSVAAFAFSFIFAKIKEAKPVASWRKCSSRAAHISLLGRPGPQKGEHLTFPKAVNILSPFL